MSSSSLTNISESCLAQVGVYRAQLPMASQSRLTSNHPLLDACLEGGLRYGEVSEWGMPFGRGGREVVLAYLAQATQRCQWSLWVSSRRQVQPYPPAWAARGVALKYVRFVTSDAAVKELRPLFLDPFFRVVVLDAPQNFTHEDCAFLAQQARKHGQAIILLRDFFLTEKYGNIWARLRVNCWQEAASPQFSLRTLRGVSPRQISFALAED